MPIYIIIICVVIYFLFSSFKPVEETQPVVKSQRYVNNNILNSGFIRPKEETPIKLLHKEIPTVNGLSDILSIKTHKDYSSLLSSFFNNDTLKSLYVDDISNVKNITEEDVKLYAITCWIYCPDAIDFEEYISFLNESLTYNNVDFCKKLIDWKIKKYSRMS